MGTGQLYPCINGITATTISELHGILDESMALFLNPADVRSVLPNALMALL